MSVIVLCPNCGQAVPFYRAPVDICPRCQAPYPVETRAAADRALAVAQAPKPPLLLLGQLLSAFGSGFFLLFVVLALFGVGRYSIDQQAVSNTAFLLEGGGLTFILIGGWLAAVAVGLWRDREWARPLMLAFWPLNAAIGLAFNWTNPRSTTGDLIADVVALLIPLALAWWYLYRKPNVVAYFDAHADPEPAPPPAPLAS